MIRDKVTYDAMHQPQLEKDEGIDGLDNAREDNGKNDSNNVNLVDVFNLEKD